MRKYVAYALFCVAGFFLFFGLLALLGIDDDGTGAREFIGSSGLIIAAVVAGFGTFLLTDRQAQIRLALGLMCLTGGLSLLIPAFNSDGTPEGIVWILGFAGLILGGFLVAPTLGLLGNRVSQIMPDAPSISRSSTTSAPSMADELRELKAMFDQGTIDETEYNKLKQRIIDKNS